MSIEKTKEFFNGLTDDKVDPSVGMINSLAGNLSAISETERKKIFASLLQSPGLLFVPVKRRSYIFSRIKRDIKE